MSILNESFVTSVRDQEPTLLNASALSSSIALSTRSAAVNRVSMREGLSVRVSTKEAFSYREQRDDSDDENGTPSKLDRGQSPTWGQILNAIAYLAAPMAMPATMATAGWIGGSILLFYCCVATYQSAEIIHTLCQRFPDVHSYPKLAQEVVRMAMPSKYSAYQIDRMSKFAAFGCQLLQFLAYYFGIVSMLIYEAQYLDQLLPKSPICQWLWLLVIYILVLPLMTIPSFTESRWMSIPSVLCICTYFAIFVIEVARTKPWECNPGPTYQKPKVLDIFVSLSAFAYMFGGHGMFPEMIREMRKPQEFTKVINWTYGVIMVQYIVCGYLGFYAYGSFVDANINLMWPYDAWNITSIVLQLLNCYYGVFIGNIGLMLNTERSMGLLITNQGLQNRLKRFIFRAIFIGIQVLFAQFLLGGSGDTLMGLQSLSGAIGMTALTFFLPFVMFWICYPQELSFFNKCTFAFHIALGVIIMFAGISSSLTDIIQDSSGTLNASCHLDIIYSNDTCNFQSSNQ